MELCTVQMLHLRYSRELKRSSLNLGKRDKKVFLKYLNCIDQSS